MAIDYLCSTHVWDSGAQVHVWATPDMLVIDGEERRVIALSDIESFDIEAISEGRATLTRYTPPRTGILVAVKDEAPILWQVVGTPIEARAEFGRLADLLDLSRRGNVP